MLRDTLLGLSLATLGLGTVACSGLSGTGPDPAGAPASIAALAWKPGPADTCPISVHDKYSTVGPDGKRYPTWHPPVDPETGCTFGHEHGRDPHGSNLYSLVGDIPLGYANEQLDTWDPSGKRHEDHYGHKYEWENDVAMHVSNAAGTVLSVKCDIMYKLHQGTHSKDAFTNNLHEVVYHARCNDGTEVHMTIMAAIGTPGGFTRTCDGARVDVGPPNPANSPHGGGQRVIPDRTCVDRFFLTPDGTAYLDFSGDALNGYAPGIASESLAVYSIVNSLAANIPAVKKVRLLLQGQEVETLHGHADLTDSYVPDPQRVAPTP